MFFNVNLILICAVLFNISDVNSDCNDFIECVGDWIGGLLTNDKKNVPVKAVEVPDTISAVEDLLSDISRLIENNFNLTKETSITRNVENRTEIHVETFKINNTHLIDNNQTSEVNDTKLPNAIENGTVEQNGTNNIVNNIYIDVIFESKENRTKTTEIENDQKDDKLSSEIPITITDSEYVSTINNLNYSINNNISYESMTTDNSIKMALFEDNLNNRVQLPEVSYTNTGFGNSSFAFNFTEVANHYNINFTFDSPLNTTNVVVNNTANFGNQNSSNILLINIPETVATNYKITFESPINVTYFDINVNDQVNAKTNTTNLNNKEDSKNSIENRNIQENEIIATEYEFDDVISDVNATDYLAIDYIDLYKDTTNEDLDYTPATYIPTTTEAAKPSVEVNETNGIYTVFPWIATVFIKNNDNGQFEYICDGAVLSERVILTAARCVMKANMTEDVENILVILGKRSLQETGPNEKVLRVKSVKLHENFTAAEGKVDNDLAIIILAEPIAFNDDIKPVPLKSEDEFEAIQTATTGWLVTGRLTPIYFDKESSKTCKKNTDALYTFCAVFGDDITTCPSYGGLFVASRSDTEWSLQGLTAGSPTNRGACFNKNVTFTTISRYYQWIMNNIVLNKV